MLTVSIASAFTKRVCQSSRCWNEARNIASGYCVLACPGNGNDANTGECNNPGRLAVASSTSPAYEANRNATRTTITGIRVLPPRARSRPTIEYTTPFAWYWNVGTFASAQPMPRVREQQYLYASETRTQRIESRCELDQPLGVVWTALASSRAESGRHARVCRRLRQMDRRATPDLERPTRACGGHGRRCGQNGGVNSLYQIGGPSLVHWRSRCNFEQRTNCEGQHSCVTT